MFLSAVWTLIITAPIHCRGSTGAIDVMLHFSRSVLMKKQTDLHLEWPEDKSIFSQFFIFALTIPLMQANVLKIFTRVCIHM